MNRKKNRNLDLFRFMIRLISNFPDSIQIRFISIYLKRDSIRFTIHRNGIQLTNRFKKESIHAHLCVQWYIILHILPFGLPGIVVMSNVKCEMWLLVFGILVCHSPQAHIRIEIGHTNVFSVERRYELTGLRSHARFYDFENYKILWKVYFSTSNFTYKVKYFTFYNLDNSKYNEHSSHNTNLL